MPTKRTRRMRSAALKFDSLVASHLATDDCLFAGPGRGCGCGMIDYYGVFREALAREFWRDHRAAIIAETPAGEQPWVQLLFGDD